LPLPVGLTVAAALEVKLKSPDGLTITTKGVSPHEEKKTDEKKPESQITGSIEAKKVVQKGITATGGWTNANVMSAKVELDDILAAGVKAEFLGTFSPQGGLQKQKGNLFFKNGAFHARAFGEFHPTTGNVTTTVDGVVAHEGFLVGGEAGFDVQKAQLTRYAAAFGYHAPTYSMAVTATNNLKLFSASYYHKVNEAVEAGVKAAYDTKTKSTVGIEVASKYKIDPTSFAKFKLNDRGIISLAYNSKINSGFTFGIGASLDSQKLNEAGHKIGTSFTFEG
jgi:voltage-dependent anion channel protein 2